MPQGCCVLLVASGSGSSSGTSSSFGGWLSGNIGDFSGYLISFLVVTCIALAISYYCWPQRTKKCLGACCFGCLNCCKALSRKAGHRGASKRQKKKKENCKAADSESDTPSEDEAGSDDGESVKSRGKKGKNRGSRGGNRGDDDVDPEVTTLQPGGQKLFNRIAKLT